MPIESNRVRMIKDKNDSGMNCVVEERDRIIAEFSEFIAVGIVDDELRVTTVANPEQIAETIVALIGIYKDAWEQMYKEVYGYPKEISNSDLIETFVKAVNKNVD